MNSSIVLAHPFGNANVRQALRTFHDVNLLDRFITTISAEHLMIRKVLPRAIRTEVDRRRFPDLPIRLIQDHPLYEALRLLGKRVSHTFPALANAFPSVDDIWTRTDRELLAYIRKRHKENLTIYAYEDGAFHTFSSGMQLQKVYELPIGYWRNMHAILDEERDLNPEWGVTLSGLKDPREKLERKDVELDLADKIIVPSDFVNSTLPEHHRCKTAIVPYGCPPAIDDDQIFSSERKALRVFFCGSLGQRKGISYLFQAIERMGSSVELTVVGAEVTPCPVLTRALSRVKWHRSLPHRQVLALMRESDVLVFPTLFEGRALVVLEALAQGIPVITTANSGTSDVIIDGKSGFLVPVRSTDAICEALELLYRDRELLEYMKREALKVARSSGWDSYRRKLLATMSDA
jgi:glycosyltransferase involved in cell wall biosynthesis